MAVYIHAANFRAGKAQTKWHGGIDMKCSPDLELQL